MKNKNISTFTWEREFREKYENNWKSFSSPNIIIVFLQGSKILKINSLLKKVTILQKVPITSKLIDLTTVKKNNISSWQYN